MICSIEFSAGSTGETLSKELLPFIRRSGVTSHWNLN